MTQASSPFDAGITFILSKILQLPNPFTHPVVLVIQYHEREFEYFDLLDLGLNEVFYLKYPTRKDTKVIKVLSESKARSLQSVIAYSVYLLCKGNDTYHDPTQWDVDAFKRWRRASCSLFIAGRMQYEESRKELEIIHKESDRYNEEQRMNAAIWKEQQRIKPINSNNTVKKKNI